MQTYNLELKHGPSKNGLNRLADNRLPPLRRRLADDEAAIAWAKAELKEFAQRHRGPKHRYVEAALTELLPIGVVVFDRDFRRLGRWVSNIDGVNWRPSPGPAAQAESRREDAEARS
jgi:hypothetical protein